MMTCLCHVILYIRMGPRTRYISTPPTPGHVLSPCLKVMPPPLQLCWDGGNSCGAAALVAAASTFAAPLAAALSSASPRLMASGLRSMENFDGSLRAPLVRWKGYFGEDVCCLLIAKQIRRNGMQIGIELSRFEARTMSHFIFRGAMPTVASFGRHCGPCKVRKRCPIHAPS